MSLAKQFPNVLNINQPSGNDLESLLQWAQNVTNVLGFMQREMSEAFQNVVLEGTTSEKPLASGSGRLYYDTTLNQLEYDDGSWNVV